MLARLREPSTWRGLIWLLTALGVTLRPEVWEQITALGMAAAGLIGVLTHDPLPPIELQGRATGDAGGPGQLRQSLPPDYSPKEPRQPVDSPPGWNG